MCEQQEQPQDQGLPMHEVLRRLSQSNAAGPHGGTNKAKRRKRRKEGRKQAREMKEEHDD